jgi:SNF2 family DNA or RNA helicase
MATTFHPLRQWAIRQTPIVQPAIYEIDVSDGQDGRKPTISDVFEPLSEPHRARLRFTPLLDHPPILDLSTLFNYPAILDLFTGLEMPGKAGKTYGEKITEVSTRSAVSPATSQRKDEADPNERCRHGVKRAYCAICLRKSAPVVKRPRHLKTSKREPTINAFDLLLPYLQPPLSALLANRLLFPLDRRPYDYQVDGIKFLEERKSALLGDEMGLGKTIQAIIALQVLYRRGDVHQTLILCPRSLLKNWENEIAKWASEFFVQRVRGTPENRRLLWKAPASIYLTTYATLRQDVKNNPTLQDKFQVVILDEVQKIKNPSSGISKAVRQIDAKYRWGLSGTPLENRVDDVVAIFNYLRPDLLSRNMSYRSQTVKTSIEPFFLRRRLGDVRKELPKKITTTEWIKLTGAQRASYDRAEGESRKLLQGENASRIHVFAEIAKLKQICNLDPATGKSSKAERLIEILEEGVQSGHKALVFSHLPHKTLRPLEPRLQRFHPKAFHGGLNDRERETLIEDFNTNGNRPKVLLMSLQAGGVGLNLTAASYVVHFDHWWNPATARQAEARAHRIGQKREVMVYNLYTEGTIEERIYRLLQEKQQLFDVVIDDLSEEYTGTPGEKVTDEELFALFGLRPPAVE